MTHIFLCRSSSIEEDCKRYSHSGLDRVYQLGMHRFELKGCRLFLRGKLCICRFGGEGSEGGMIGISSGLGCIKFQGDTLDSYESRC